jgi:hypothetical protein
MKTKIKYIVSIAAILASSCVDIDLKPIDNYGVNVMSDPKSTNYIINLAYGRLMGRGAYEYYGRAFIYLNDLTSDDADYIAGESPNAQRTELDLFTYNASNENIVQVWPSAYDLITTCNSLLDVTKQEQNPTAVGQALFLRSLCYFNLVRLYGGVPLYLSVPMTNEELSNASRKKRNSINEVYDQIVKDMENVVSNNMLPSVWAGDEKGRASKWAAETMLAHIYLTMASPGTEYTGKKETEWLQRALVLLKDIKDNSSLALEPNYNSLWLVANEYTNSEVIFDIGCNGRDLPNGGIPGRYTTSYNPIDRAGWANGWGNNVPSLSSFNSFDSKDTRKKAFVTSFVLSADRLSALSGSDIDRDASNRLNLARVSTVTSIIKHFYPGDTVSYEYWQTASGQRHIARPHLGKFADRSGVYDPFPNVDDHNFIIYRYADVLLMFAEVENELNGPTALAYSAINEVRTRAFGGESGTGIDIPAGLDKTAFKNELMKERRKEFFQEAKRWFDLLRWNTFMEVMTADGKNVHEYNRYFPIPQPERERNPNLEQNLGY